MEFIVTFLLFGFFFFPLICVFGHMEFDGAMFFTFIVWVLLTIAVV